MKNCQHRSDSLLNKKVCFDLSYRLFNAVPGLIFGSVRFLTGDRTQGISSNKDLGNNQLDTLDCSTSTSHLGKKKV